MPPLNKDVVRLPVLSKSSYVAGLQCERRLWHYYHSPELNEPPTAAMQAIFDTGHLVGEVARKLFPKGVLLPERRDEKNALLEETKQLIESKVPALFEGAFRHERVFVRPDILVRVHGGYDLIEVKSSTKVRPVYEDDLAVQAWVLRGAGVPVKRTFVMTLNREYVRGDGDLDLEALFSLHDRTDYCSEAASEVAQRVHQFLRVLECKDEPNIEPGDQCSQPYECGYHAHCSAELELAEYPIESLPRLTKSHRDDLRGRGIFDIRQIPEDEELSPSLERIRESVVRGEEYRSPSLAHLLETVEYPVHHIDFETVNPAIPRYPGQSPYDAFPFQWSNHIEEKSGSVRHSEFLAERDEDPREAFVESLLHSLEGAGTIVVYSSFERSQLNRLADLYPKHRSRITQTLAKFWDLLEVLRTHYYHPDFGGSYSIKRVIPALVPELRYDDLAIRDGSTASSAYQVMFDGETEAIRREARESLLAYCARDTLAMLAIRRTLAEKKIGLPPAIY